MMEKIAGGVWGAGAFNNNMQLDSPALTPYQMNRFLSLTDDPLGRGFAVLRTHIAQSDFAAGANELSTERAEMQSRSTVSVWGVEYTYHWRLIIPPKWINHGADSFASVAQLHDVNAPGIGRRPTFMVELIDNQLHFVLSRTDDPLGIELFALDVSPGDDISFTIQAKWADGFHVPAAEGVFRIYTDAGLVASLDGQKNTWDSGAPEEPSPPYLKAGIYQPLYSAPWWTGKQIEMYHVASAIYTTGTTHAQAVADVADELVATDAWPIVP